MISYIVMAAGLSSRFNSPKALALIENEPCINYLLKKLVRCPVNEIIVVLGAHYDEIYPLLFKHTLIRVVYNNDYNFGQTSSAITGLRETEPTSSAFALHPVDCPFIESETIDHLVNEFKKKHCDVLIPRYESRKGHPPVINQKIKELILNLGLDAGINTVFDSKAHKIDFIETKDPGVIQSFNTVEELGTILKSRREAI